MIPTTLKRAAVEELRTRVRGEIVQPGDAAYEEARAVYNAMHSRWPALVLRAAGADDVAAAVDFARTRGLLLAVRGGGHSVPGFGSCDDGLVLDLGGMRRVEVDPERRAARAEAGCTWADLNDAMHAFGLATPGGLISTTGIAGLTLGGGIGYLTRRHGLSCDNLLSADVVTADGERLTCSARQNAELFWALRGGGGNFGVVTSFEFRLHPVSHVLGGPIFFPLDRDVIRGYRDLLPRAPEELGAVLGLTRAPSAPFLPEAWHGRPVAVVVVCWAGPTPEGEEILRPLDAWAPVVGRHVGPMPYPLINTLFDALLPRGLRHYWKSHFVPQIPDEAVDILLERAARVPTIESGIFFYPVDGACQRIGVDETAFAHRNATFAIGIHGSWRDPGDDARSLAWVCDCYEALRPYAAEGEYVNFTSDGGPTGVAASYGPNYRRLVEVKQRHDPRNLFCLNQNIDPAL